MEDLNTFLLAGLLFNQDKYAFIQMVQNAYPRCPIAATKYAILLHQLKVKRVIFDICISFSIFLILIPLCMVLDADIDKKDSIPLLVFFCLIPVLLYWRRRKCAAKFQQVEDAFYLEAQNEMQTPNAPNSGDVTNIINL